MRHVEAILTVVVAHACRSDTTKRQRLHIDVNIDLIDRAAERQLSDELAKSSGLGCKAAAEPVKKAPAKRKAKVWTAHAAAPGGDKAGSGLQVGHVPAS